VSGGPGWGWRLLGGDEEALADAPAPVPGDVVVDTRGVAVGGGALPGVVVGHRCVRRHDVVGSEEVEARRRGREAGRRPDRDEGGRHVVCVVVDPPEGSHQDDSEDTDGFPHCGFSLFVWMHVLSASQNSLKRVF
jgi:hypothetical protein